MSRPEALWYTAIVLVSLVAVVIGSVQNLMLAALFFLIAMLILISLRP